MRTGSLIGILLVLVALADVVIGWTVVVPRAPEESRPLLRVAFVAGAAVLVLVGSLLLTGVIRVG